MTLVITNPANVAPAFNPIVLSATSDVRDDYTIGALKTILSIANNNGLTELTFDGVHSLLKGNYILITSAESAEFILGVALVVEIVSTTVLVINKSFLSSVLTDDGICYKFLNNYNAFLKFYIYALPNGNVPIFASSLTYKPKFVDGFCDFKIDLSSLAMQYNYYKYSAIEILKSEFFPLDGSQFQANNKSFVKYGFELSEGFDGPSGGLPTYINDTTAT